MDTIKLSFTLPLLSMTLCYSLHRGFESVLVVAIPQIGSDEITVSWERGPEILPGALEAVKGINNEHSGLVQGNKLTLVIADSGLVTSSDYLYSGNVLEIIANLTVQNVEIIDVAGVLHPNTLGILQSLQLRIASLIQFNGIPNIPNVVYMTASTSTVIDAFLASMKVISQSRIGIITEINNSFHLKFLHKVHSKVNVSF